MNLTITESTTFQIPKQVSNLVSSSGIFQKQSVKKIVESKVTCCNITFSDFDNIFEFEITEIIWNGFSEQITFVLNYKNLFFLRLRLNGYWELEKEQTFQLIDVDWFFEENESNPISAFILETFKTIISLSDRVKVEIPIIDYWFRVKIPLPLSEISKISQNRHLAYQLMIIEKTFQISLPFPRRFISGEEIENITFCYKAIIEREFDLLFSKTLTFFPLSTTEYVDLLPQTNSSFPLSFPTNDEKRVIFGHSLNLKQLFIEIDRAIVINYEEAKQKMLELSGKRVEVIIRAANGKMRFKSINVPTLPQNAFNKEIQQLIDLEEKLNSVYFEKYLNSFSNAFEGLTEEQIQAVTERPSLEEEAFNF